MANQANIKFGVGFEVDKSGLNGLKAALKDLQNIGSVDLINTADAQVDIQKIINMAKQVEGALEKSYNAKLGTYNVTAFNQELHKTGSSLQSIHDEFAKAGEKGVLAFRQMSNAVTSTKLKLKETHNLLESMGTTLMNTIKWSIASNALNTFTGSIQKAYSFTKQLDTSLNDIMIVTGKSSDEMGRFAYRANKAAKALGAATKDYTQASLIYYQQGLSDSEVETRANTTLKAANVTGQDARTVSEQLTAVWNGYKVQAQETELYIDKLAAVAAATAADLEELSTGMSKVASAANTMGVDIDQLNAQLATIVSVTREAPEAIGTALKTVYARMSDIQAGLDEETTLDEYTQQLADMGIYVLDAQGQLRDMGEVVEEIGDSWDKLSRNQQVSLAQTVAGTRQYSRMMALFDNWDMYQTAKNTSATSTGTLQEQQDIFLESLEAHTQALATAGEKVYAALFDSESFKDLLGILTGLTEGLGNFIEGIGGGGNALLMLGSTAMRVFDKQIAEGLSTSIWNIKNAKENTEKLNEAINNLKSFDVENLDDTTKKIQDMRKDIYTIRKMGLVDNEEMNELIAQVDEYEKLANSISEVKIGIKSLDDALDKDATFQREKTKYGLRQVSSGQFAKPIVHLEDINKQASKLMQSGITNEEDLLAANENLKAYKQQLSEAQAYTNQLIETAKTAATNFSEGVDVEDSVAAYKEALTSLVQDSGLLDEQNKNQINQLLDALDEKSTTLLEAHQKVEKLQQELENIDDADSTEAKILKNKLASAKRAETIATSSYQKALEKADKFTEEIEAKANKTVEELTKAAEKTAKGITAETEEELTRIARDMQDTFDRIDLTNTIKNITDLAGAVGQVSSGILALKNIGNIWSNEDLSTGEKILQTIMSLSTALPMLVSGFTAAKAVWAKLPPLGTLVNATYVKFIKNQAAAAYSAKIEADALKASTDASLKNAYWTKILEEAKENLTEEQYNQALASLASAKGLDAETEALIKNAAAQKYADSMQTSGKGGFKNFIGGIGGKIKGGAQAVGKVLPVALFAVAAVASVAGAYKYITNWYKQEEIAAQKAKEAASQANEQTESLRQTYEDLKSTIDSYSDQKTSLDELTKGTQDYKDALHGANEEVLKLLQLYPELVNYITDSEDHEGLLEVSEEGLEKAQEVLAAQLAAARAIETGLNATALQKQQDQKIAEQARDIKTSGQTASEWGTGVADGVTLGVAGGVAGGVLGGAVMGGSLGAAAGPVGAIVGAVVGLAAAAVTTVAATSESIQASNEELTRKAAELYLKDATLFQGDAEEIKQKLSEGLNLNDDALLTSLYNNHQSIVELSAEVKANTEAIKKQRKYSMSEYLTSLNNTRYNNTKFQDQIDERLASFVTEEKIKEYETKAEDEWDKDIHKVVAEAYGWDYVENGSGVGKFVTTDADGNITNFELGDESLRAMWAQIKALEEAGLNISDAVNAVEKVADTGYENVDRQLANAVTGVEIDLESLTENELKIFNKSLKETSLLTQAELKALGYTSIDEITNFSSQALTDFQEKLDKLIDSIPEGEYRNKYNALFENNGALANSDLTYQSKENLAQIYASQNGALVNGLESLISSLDDDADDFLNLLPGLESYQDLEKFQNALYENTELSYLLTDNIFKNFVAGLETTFNLTEEWNKQKSQERIGTLQSIGNSLKSFGDSISPEQFEELTPELKTYFTEMADGTYQLTIAAEDFNATLRNLLRTESERKLLEKREELDAEKSKESDVTNQWAEYGLKQQQVIDNALSVNMASPEQRESAISAYKEKYQDNLGSPEATNAGIQLRSSYFQQAKNVYDELKTKTMPDGTNMIAFLESQGVDIEYWEDQLNSGSITTGVYDGIWIAKTQYEQAWNDWLASYQPEISQGAYDANIQKLTKEELELQNSNASLAGSKEKFEEQVASGIITDPKIIETWTKYYEQQRINELPSRLEKLDTELELKLNTEEALRTLNDFRRQTEEDLSFSELGQLAISDFQSYQRDYVNILQAIAELEQESLDGETYKAQKQEKLNLLQETALSLQESINVAQEEYSNWLDKINESWDQQIEYLNVAVELTEHQQELQELMYGENATMALGYQNTILQGEKAKYDILTAQYAEIKAQYDNIDNLNLSDEDIEAIKDQYFSIGQEVVAEAKTIAQVALDAFALNVESTLNNTLLGTSVENWNLQKDRQDWTSDQANSYFDNINREYQIGNIERMFNQSIRENSANIKAQQRLNELKEQELAALREKDKLTEKDIERVNKRLELEQALIALEDARNNTSQMRLIRGSDGTYSYEYVADMDAVLDAESKVEDAKNELYNFEKDRYQAELDAVYDQTQEFMDKVKELSANGLTEEEKEYLRERWSAIQESIKQSEINLAEFEETMSEVFGNSLESGDFAAMGISNAFKSMIENLPVTDIEELFNNITDSYNSYISQIPKTKDIVEEVGEAASLENEKIKNSLFGENGLLSEDTKKKMDDLNGSIANMEGNFANVRKQVMSLTQDLVTLLSFGSNGNFDMFFSNISAPLTENSMRTLASGFLGDRDMWGDKAGYYVKDTNKWNSFILSLFEYLPEEQRDTFEQLKYGLTNDNILWDEELDQFYQLFKVLNEAKGFDTGGYTGAWGADGRLAMLHEKELVLNKEDTSNILSAVSIMRDISAILDMSLKDSLGKLVANVSGMVNMGNAEENTFEQNVTIQAEFPNATDREEIKAAFEELALLAAQRVGQNKRK